MWPRLLDLLERGCTRAAGALLCLGVLLLLERSASAGQRWKLEVELTTGASPPPEYVCAIAPYGEHNELRSLEGAGLAEHDDEWSLSPSMIDEAVLRAWAGRPEDHPERDPVAGAFLALAEGAWTESGACDDTRPAQCAPRLKVRVPIEVDRRGGARPVPLSIECARNEAPHQKNSVALLLVRVPDTASAARPRVDGLGLVGNVVTITIDSDRPPQLQQKQTAIVGVLGGHYFRGQTSVSTAQRVRLQLDPRCDHVPISIPPYVRDERHRARLAVVLRRNGGDVLRCEHSELEQPAIFIPRAFATDETELELELHPSPDPQHAIHLEQRWVGQLEGARVSPRVTRFWMSWRSPCQAPVYACPHVQLESGATCEAIGPPRDAECRYECRERDNGDALHVDLPTRVDFSHEYSGSRWSMNLARLNQRLRGFDLHSDVRFRVVRDGWSTLRSPADNIDSIALDTKSGSQVINPSDRSLLIPRQTCDATARYTIQGDRSYDTRPVQFDWPRLSIPAARHSSRMAYLAIALEGGYANVWAKDYPKLVREAGVYDQSAFGGLELSLVLRPHRWRWAHMSIFLDSTFAVLAEKKLINSVRTYVYETVNPPIFVPVEDVSPARAWYLRVLLYERVGIFVNDVIALGASLGGGYGFPPLQADRPAVQGVNTGFMVVSPGDVQIAFTPRFSLVISPGRMILLEEVADFEYPYSVSPHAENYRTRQWSPSIKLRSVWR